MEVSKSVLIKLRTAVKKFLRNFRGAILIEFAVGMPLLLMLLFGMHDIFKMSQMQDKVNFAAHLVVQMLQNISQGRTDKKITRTDLGNIARFASYSIYPGKTGYALGSNKYTHAHCLWVAVIYVKGESEGKATEMWRAYFFPDKPANNLAKAHVAWGISASKFDTRLQNVVPSRIWPTLQIAEGEVKIIVEAFIFTGGNSGRSKYPNDSAPTTDKQLFGTYLLTPSCKQNNWYKGFFHSVAIFTPKRGLFSETAPQ